MPTESIGQAALDAYAEQSQGNEPPQELQAKPAIGSSTDPLEQEADRVAEQVMRIPAEASVAGLGRRKRSSK